MAHKIGLIGMISEELKKDRRKTLARMAELGYQGIEGSFLVGDTEEETRGNRRELDEFGLESVAVCCSQTMENELENAVRNAHLLGAKYIVSYFAKPENDDELMKLAEQFERMAVKCESEGLRYIYHNHEHEFSPMFGKRGRECIFDILCENTEKLGFELDIAWCHFGGCDPVSVIRRAGHRIPVLHVKDLSDDNIRGHFCAVGLGKVNCFGCIEAAAAKGAEWMVVEQDRPGNLTHYESAIASILNIRETGLLNQRKTKE